MTPSRAERVAQAQTLRGEGLKLREIAERMGVAISTVDSWINDPDGSRHRARKQSYSGRCEDCGSPTSADRKGVASRYCWECWSTAHAETWSPDVIVAAIQRFAERYGRPPAAADFSPAHARILGHHWRAERFHRDGDYPYPFTVIQKFGTWNAAISAAGFMPTDVGKFARLSGCHEAAHLYRDEAR